MAPAAFNSDGTSQLEYASPWKRLAAFFIDLPVVFLLGGACRTLFVQFQGLDILVVWLYFAAMEGSNLQATLGKKVLGLKVAGLAGDGIGFWRASARYWVKLISVISLGAGFALVFFTDKKQAFHDYVVGCVVLEANVKSKPSA